MIRIGLLSDTHGFLHPKVFEFLQNCDEIWHAGDIGNQETAERLSSFKTLRAVYGNIDGQDIRIRYPRIQNFYAEEMKVLMTHIGGYPGRYEQGIRELLVTEKPDIFISGHSHILKVMYDKKYGLLHINPGAAGSSGFHKSITMIRFNVDAHAAKDMEILDIPRNG